MKIYSHFLRSIFLVFIFSTSYATIVNSDLIASYPFNGNAQDISGNNKHGIVNGASLTTDRNGIANSAYNFNGVSDYINLPFTFGPYSEFSATAWFRLDATSNNIQAVLSSDTSCKLVHMQVNTSANAGQALYYSFPCNTAILLPIPIPTLNQWHQLTITCKSGLNRAYYDGVLVKEDHTTYTSLVYADLLRIGSGNANVRFFHGKIDDVRMYNRALTFEEVSELFQSENPTSNYNSYYINCFLQGYYQSGTQMKSVLNNQGIMGSTLNDVDTVRVTFRYSNASLPYTYSYKSVLQKNGNITVLFPSSLPSGNYSIEIKHRNTPLITTSYFPITNGGSLSLSSAIANSDGYRKPLGPGVYGYLTGDVNQDLNIDLLDILPVENDVLSFTSGYYATDLNGDGNVDLLDLNFLEQNVVEFLNGQ